MTNGRLNIGLFICHLDNDYAFEICKGAEHAAKEMDVNLVVFPGMFLSASFNDPENAIYDYQYNSVFYYANKENLDALIISVGTIKSFLSQRKFDEFLANFEGIPIITLEMEEGDKPYIMTDNKSGLRDAIEHLITVHNRKHICFVSGRRSSMDAVERLMVYKEVLANHGMKATEDMIVYGDYSEYSRTIVGELLDKNPDVDAIVFANDQMAIGGYQEMKARGIHIGHGVSVIGFDNSPASITMLPPLTTVNAGIPSLGYRAIENAIALAKGKDVKSEMLSSQLVRRISCGCTHHFGVENCTCENRDQVENLIKVMDETILGYIQNTFYGPRVIKGFNDIWRYILNICTSDKVDGYPANEIISMVENLLTSDMTQFFSATSMAYAFSGFASIMTSFIKDPVKLQEFYRLNFAITESISQLLSSTLYNQVHGNKANEWASIYITRDTLTHGDDINKTYECMLAKLKDIGFKGSYLLTYDKPIQLLADGRWVVPDTIFLQAFFNEARTAVLSGETRRIASTDIIDNEYTFYRGRFTNVVMPIFTNELHHGLFVATTDINGFKDIYSTGLHLGASFKYLTLLAEQCQTKEQLIMSLNEIHEKNTLLNQWSTTDELTGINNRRGLMEKVEYLINKPDNKGRKAMLLFADMDSLKVVNDTFGHADGDFALKNIARILTKSLGPGNVVGRIGGDEFVCFAFLDDASFATKVQEDIRALSAELNETSGKPYYVEMSVGVSEFECTGDMKIENLLSQADNALYTNKRYKRLSVLK